MCIPFCTFHLDRSVFGKLATDLKHRINYKGRGKRALSDAFKLGVGLNTIVQDKHMPPEMKAA